MGVALTGGGTIVNTGTIAGGDGPSSGPGSGGVGVWASGNASIVNAGAIEGGNDNSSSGHARAVVLSGGSNTLTLLQGYSFAGTVLSASGTNNGGDTLVLGGDTIAGGTIPTFNASSIVATGTGTQFVGFSNFVKTGAASWMLTGNGTGQNWTIANGTLIGDTNSFTGDLLFAAVPGDSAQVKFQQDSSGTYAGRIDGVGTLLKAGTGTLTFTTAHTYTGQTAVGQGTLALSGAGGIAGSTLVVGPAGTFDISATNGSSVQGLVGDGTVELGADRRSPCASRSQGEAWSGGCPCAA